MKVTLQGEIQALGHDSAALPLCRVLYHYILSLQY